ncbi:hypothetical protein T11_18477, partial [Trichinella zimbabwensis]
LKSPFSHVSDGPRHDLVHPRSIFGVFSVKLPEKSLFTLFRVTHARPRSS